MSDLFPVVVIGSGNMGAALARSLRRANPDATILGVDPDGIRLETLRAEGVLTPASSDWRLEKGTLVLAIKPQVLESVAAGLKPRLGKDVVVRGRINTDPTAQVTTAQGKTITPDLAVTLDLGPNFVVKGRGLSTRLAGQLVLTSSADTKGQPRLNGTVRTVRGTSAAGVPSYTSARATPAAPCVGDTCTV